MPAGARSTTGRRPARYAGAAFLRFSFFYRAVTCILGYECESVVTTVRKEAARDETERPRDACHHCLESKQEAPAKAIFSEDTAIPAEPLVQGRDRRKLTRDLSLTALRAEPFPMGSHLNRAFGAFDRAVGIEARAGLDARRVELRKRFEESDLGGIFDALIEFGGHALRWGWVLRAIDEWRATVEDDRVSAADQKRWRTFSVTPTRR